MAIWRCEICNSETDSSHRARHSRTKKHLSAAEQQNVIEENPLYHYDDYDFETKCEVCKIKVSNLEEHLKTFSHEKKVNPTMQIFDEVYGLSSDQNQNEIYIRCRLCNEEIKYSNRLRHIKSISHKEKDLDKEIDVFQTLMKRKFNTIRFYNLNNFKYALIY